MRIAAIRTRLGRRETSRRGRAAKAAESPLSGRKKSRLWIAWVLIAPALLIRGFTTVYPIIMTFYNSLFEINGFTGGIPSFVGLENYTKIFEDPKLQTSLQFTVIFTVFSMLFHILLGLGLALLLNQKFKGQRFLRTIVLIPWAMPTVVAGMAGRWGFNDSFGLINDLIRRFINPDFYFDWLVHPAAARFAVIAVDLWKDIPFFAILMLASLQFIPTDIYEAARIDGASSVRCFFSITLPNISKALLTQCIFFTMWRITSFDLVYAMTSGGPGDSTTLLAYRIMLEAFNNLNLGYASAIAVFMFVIMAALSGLNLFAAKKVPGN